MKRIVDDELKLLSNEIDVPFEHLKKLNATDMLNIPVVLRFLVMRDYAKLKKMGMYMENQMIDALAMKYDILKYKVKALLCERKRKKTKYYCKSCDKPISTSENKQI